MIEEKIKWPLATSEGLNFLSASELPKDLVEEINPREPKEKVFPLMDSALADAVERVRRVNPDLVTLLQSYPISVVDYDPFVSSAMTGYKRKAKRKHVMLQAYLEQPYSAGPFDGLSPGAYSAVVARDGNTKEGITLTYLHEMGHMMDNAEEDQFASHFDKDIDEFSMLFSKLFGVSMESKTGMGRALGKISNYALVSKWEAWGECVSYYFSGKPLPEELGWVEGAIKGFKYPLGKEGGE